ncbi:MAG: MBL fold metallo-hydrolase [Gammaproteobacteria bacterium]
MRFAVLSSGSAGNATVVATDTTAVLIDCGISLKELERRASSIDFDLGVLTAILITHEHDDHIGSVHTVARAHDVPVFATRGTFEASNGRLDRISQKHIFGTEQSFAVGDLEITPVIVPHDAREPSQFVVSNASARLGILTDLGHSTRHLERHYNGLDALIIEFNHDLELLANGAYPATLKSRIGGPYGHLSNPDTVALLRRLDCSRLRVLIAAHLSEKTNAPDIVEACFSELAFQDTECMLAAQDEAMPWIELSSPPPSVDTVHATDGA